MHKHVRTCLFHAALSLTLVTMTLPASSALAQSGFRVNKNLYSETADPAAEIAAAVKASRSDHRRILLDFGGNWCSDCQLLDFYYHQSPNAELLARYYRVVHVDIGHMDHNVEIAKKYRVPIARGVPALAVLNSDGRLLYSEKEKEFEHASPEAISEFLNRWKA